MSWALSCMSLREHYSDVALYADSEAAHMLVDTLRLPYSEVVVCYDGFDCLTCHWALVKVRTYSLQTEPFLHIDGDIYLPHPIPGETLDGRLIVQNKEWCSKYYGDMIERFLSVPGLKLSERFRSVLTGNDIPSCNLGFCGGSDLKFFGRFCGEVFKFFRDNDFNGERFRYDDISANVVYEQIFFSIMARDAGIPIGTVYPKTVRDNGYMEQEFCDLAHYDSRQFIHVLDGHKRTRRVCNMVERTLFRKYPDVWRRVMDVFPGRHGLQTEAEPSCEGLAGYCSFLCQSEKDWNGIPLSRLWEEEQAVYKGASIPGALGNHDVVLRRNAFVRLYDPEETEIPRLKERLGIGDGLGNISVAAAPSVFGSGYTEVALDPIARNILVLLREPMPFASLVEELGHGFENDVPKEKVWRSAANETGRLVSEGLVIAENEAKGVVEINQERCNNKIF